MGCRIIWRRVRCALLDLFSTILTLIFFYAAAAFARGCERLAKEEQGG